jgi:uracil phosphoribosyltransferase
VKTDLSSVIAVSIIRAGDSMLDTFLSLVPEAKTGKILIQRNEMTSQPKLFYTKLPRIPSHSTVVILDPMLATGGSAIIAVKEILLQTQVRYNDDVVVAVVAIMVMMLLKIVIIANT